MSRHNTERSTFAKKTEQILNVTTEMRELFDKLNKKAKRGILGIGAQSDTTFDEHDEDTLSRICIAIKDLKDLNTLEIFVNCFGEGSIAGNKIKNYLFDKNKQNGDFESLLNGSFKASIVQLQKNAATAVNTLQGSEDIARRAANKFMGKISAKSQDIQLSQILSEPQDSIDRFVMHINNNLQNLAKLDIEISKLLALQDNKELRAFRDDVRVTFDSFTKKLLEDGSFLMLSKDSRKDRLNTFGTFILSTDYQSMTYVIADIKFRFTNQIMKNISKYESVLRANPEVFDISVPTSAPTEHEYSEKAFQKIRENSGISSLKSKNLEIEPGTESEQLIPIVKNIRDINAYMDGMISVRALLEARHKKSTALGLELRPDLDRKKVSNAILLGLDPDLGFDNEIKERYFHESNAYISGCVEECLIASSPELFFRNTEEDLKGILGINKKGDKRKIIEKALGMPDIDEKALDRMKRTGMRDELGFVDITKFYLSGLEDLFERSKARANRTGLNYTEPLWRILAAIKPIENIASSGQEVGTDPLYLKIKNYQRIIDTMQIYPAPFRGRARINLDLDNGANLMEQGRGVIDRMIHIINLHQKAFLELPTDKLKDIQTTNKSLFKSFETDFATRGIKKVSKGIGEKAYLLTHGQVPQNPESDHKRRKMKYLKLNSEINEQLGANQYAEDSSKPSPTKATQYVQDKLKKDKEALKRYVHLKDEDFEILIQNWRKLVPDHEDERQFIESKVDGYIDENVQQDADSQIKEALKDKLCSIYENIRVKTPDYVEHVEKYNSPTLLLKALDEQINKERSKIDPLDLQTDIYKIMLPVKGKVVEKLTRAQQREAELGKRDFFSENIDGFSNQELLARCDYCSNKIQNGSLSNTEKNKYYEEMNRCINKLNQSVEKLNSMDLSRVINFRQTLRLNSNDTANLHEQIRQQKNNTNELVDENTPMISGTPTHLGLFSRTTAEETKNNITEDEFNEALQKYKDLQSQLYSTDDEEETQQIVQFIETYVTESLEPMIEQWNKENPNKQKIFNNETWEIEDVENPQQLNRK